MKTMKLSIVAFLLLVCNLSVMAQHEEPVLVSVSYQFVHIYDTNNRASPIRKEMVLHIGQTNSKYNNGDVENAWKKMKKEMAMAPARPTITAIGKPMAVVPNAGNDILFQIPKEKKLISTASLGIAEYIIESTLPAIDWKIETETRKIDKYTCQKAVGSFAGRTYTAWFTAELPFENGPWKLAGLPGLILEATDSKNEVLFLFKEITQGEPDERIFSDQRRPIKVDEETFARGRNAFSQDPSGTMQSQLKGYTEPIPAYYRDPSGKLLSGDEAKEAIKNEKKIYNNPIELTKNK
ncbi:MAG: GLPGLI family protein [Bacteroidota bacterium]